MTFAPRVGGGEGTVEGARPDGLIALEAIASELGEEEASADIAALRGRLDEGRFFVACVGQFKRGKSTLLNALVGAAVLPVGVVPVTAVVTVLRYGPELRLRVRTDAWRDAPFEELASYVTEQQNPENTIGVTGVEVYVPSALLAGGMCLVDTPGLGSVFAGNTAATREFVPHVDAALVVLGADPPLSGEELTFIGEVTSQVESLLVVMNKADRVTAEEAAQARLFTESMVSKRLGDTACEVLTVSAMERLRGLKSRDWPLLESRLGVWADEKSGRLVEGARRRGVARLRARLARCLEVRRTALVHPIDESMRQLEALTRAVEEAERALLELAPLFRAEERALERALTRRRDAFLENARSVASSVLLDRLSAERGSPHLRTRAFEAAQDIAREQIEGWARALRPEADELYRRATARFLALGSDFLRRARAIGGEAFADLPEALDSERGLQARSHFYFTELLPLATPSPMSAMLFSFLARSQAVRGAHKRSAPYLVRLLETNSARMVNDLGDRVRESGSRLRAEITSVLRAVVTTAQRAIEAARSARAQGEAAIQAELVRLDCIRADLERLDVSATHDMGE